MAVCHWLSLIPAGSKELTEEYSVPTLIASIFSHFRGRLPELLLILMVSAVTSIGRFNRTRIQLSGSADCSPCFPPSHFSQSFLRPQRLRNGFVTASYRLSWG